MPIINLVYGWETAQPTPELPYLCFTANTAGSTICINVWWWRTPSWISVETSIDWIIWNTYTFGNTITLSNVWNKVYFRNASDTSTTFSLNTSQFFYFSMTWSIAASGDVNYLINKNSTETVSDYCYYQLFYNCSALTTPPKLPATTLSVWCYYYMFAACTNLNWLPELPATTLSNNSYYYMFMNCSKIKLSTTQTWEYQTPYRIPTTWTWSSQTNSLQNMFTSTWWTFTWTPSINTTYYTSNTVI